MATGSLSAVTGSSEATRAGLKFFYLGTDHTIMGFAVNPQNDINAPAQVWVPDRDNWQDVPDGQNPGGDAVWSGDYYGIDESQLPAMQQRCRDQFAGFKARSAGLPYVCISPDKRPNLLDIEREAYDRIIKTAGDHRWERRYSDHDLEGEDKTFMNDGRLARFQKGQQGNFVDVYWDLNGHLCLGCTPESVIAALAMKVGDRVYYRHPETGVDNSEAGTVDDVDTAMLDDGPVLYHVMWDGPDRERGVVDRFGAPELYRIAGQDRPHTAGSAPVICCEEHRDAWLRQT
jgi:hypothetical protein